MAQTDPFKLRHAPGSSSLLAPRPGPPPQRDAKPTCHETPYPPDVPQEIIDKIIDLCSGDTETLRACSLVSRLWVYRTRKYLFSKLILTEETLPKWCRVVTATTLNTEPGRSYFNPPPSPSCASSWLPPLVISLEIDSQTFYPTTYTFGARDLLEAKCHLSAFANLKSLALARVSLMNFNGQTLRECFGTLGETVRELKLSGCYLGEQRMFSFLRLFGHLESSEFSSPRWDLADKHEISDIDPPVLRGALTVSQFRRNNNGFLDSLISARLEYHTVTMGDNLFRSFRKFIALLVKCNVKILILPCTETTSPFHGARFDLSKCRALVEIRARFTIPEFESFFAIFETVKSPRFRKLVIFVHLDHVSVDSVEGWSEDLDAAIIATVERVKTISARDRLEVLFSSERSTDRVDSGAELFDIGEVMPLCASDPRVLLRAEYPFTLRPLVKDS